MVSLIKCADVKIYGDTIIRHESQKKNRIQKNKEVSDRTCDHKSVKHPSKGKIFF